MGWTGWLLLCVGWGHEAQGLAPVGGRRAAEVPHPKSKREKHVGLESAPTSPPAEFPSTVVIREVCPFQKRANPSEWVWSAGWGSETECALPQAVAAPQTQDDCYEGMWPQWGQVFGFSRQAGHLRCANAYGVYMLALAFISVIFFIIQCESNNTGGLRWSLCNI